MINAISLIYPRVCSSASSGEKQPQSPEGLDNKVRMLSEKAMKGLRTANIQRATREPGADYGLKGKLSRDEMVRWLDNNKIGGDAADALYSRQDSSFALTVMVLASLPRERYAGMNLSRYKGIDMEWELQRAAEYDALNDEMRIVMRFRLSDKSSYPLNMFDLQMVTDKDYAGLLMHELAHRWSRKFICDDFFSISWDEATKGSGRYSIPHVFIGRPEKRHFASQYGMSNYKEDLATIVGSMTSASQKLIGNAISLIIEDSDTTLADKIFFCYKFYERANDPDNWIVRVRKGKYVFRSKGETWSAELVGKRYVVKKCSDRFDPNVIIKNSLINDPMKARSEHKKGFLSWLTR